MSTFSSIQSRRILVIATIAVLFVLSAFLPFQQYYNGPCILTSTAVWGLYQEGSQISGVWDSNLLENQIEHIILNFDRPDIVEVKFTEGLVSGSEVEKGDTIATVISRTGISELSVIEAELVHAIAERSAMASGGRSEDLVIEQSRLQRAKTELESYRLEFDRISKLYESNVKSLSEMQAAESQLEILKSKYDLANARLKAIEAGVKPEQIQVADAEIQRLEQLVEQARNSFGKSEPILAPISGRLDLSQGQGLLCTMTRTDSLAVLMNLPEVLMADIQEGNEVSVRLYASQGQCIKSRISQINYDLDEYSGVNVLALLPNEANFLQSGMEGVMEINAGRITFLQRLKSFTLARSAGF